MPPRLMSPRLTFAQEKALAHIQEYGSLEAYDGFKVTTVRRLRDLGLVEMVFSVSSVTNYRTGRVRYRKQWTARLAEPVPEPVPAQMGPIPPSVEWLNTEQFEYALTSFLGESSPSGIVAAVVAAGDWVKRETQVNSRLDAVQVGNATSVFYRGACELETRLRAAQRRVAELEAVR
jgi:hypothetical protein